MNNDEELKKLSDTLQTINNIKANLAIIDLNPRLKSYYEFNVEPLLATLTALSTTSLNLASSLSNLALVTKQSKIKNTSHFVFDLIKESEHVYKVLKCRVDELLIIAKNE